MRRSSKLKKVTPSDTTQVKREIALMQTLVHPHIVQGMSSFVDASAVYLVTELCTRGDLCDVAAAFEKRCIPDVSVSQKARGCCRLRPISSIVRVRD